MSGISMYFTPESVNPDGNVNMFHEESSKRKNLYLTNYYDDKMLKMSISSEGELEKGFAQIKIIGYGAKRAYVWEDKPSDPKVEQLRNMVELTYHGAKINKNEPKVHIKAKTGYKTLVNDSLLLPNDIHVPVPLFSFESGYANLKKVGNTVTKKAHVISTAHEQPVRVDFYLSSNSFNMRTFVDSFYFFSFFSNQDYLKSQQGMPFDSGSIISPITLFPMGDYILFVRRSVSDYTGRPKFNFYNNKDYYQKMMGRKIAFRNQDGSLEWSTIAEEEARIRNS